MKNKSLYFIATLSTLSFIGGVFILEGKELLSKMPLSGWFVEVVLFLGWWYLMIFGISVSPRWKQVVYGLATLMFVLFLFFTYIKLR